MFIKDFMHLKYAHESDITKYSETAPIEYRLRDYAWRIIKGRRISDKLYKQVTDYLNSVKIDEGEIGRVIDEANRLHNHS